jgi:hypothetical protein
MFASGVDNIILAVNKKCSSGPHNISMILILILEEMHEAYN